jgi:alpha-beta hydrolase superfamily lysophospholipase
MRARVLAACVLALLAACSGAETPPDPAAQAPTAAATRDATRVWTQGRVIGERCPAEAWQASRISSVEFEADGGVQLYGAELGAGPRGVVLVHGTGGSALCNWGNIAPALARDGFHVLAIDQRCQGFSGCAGDGTAGLDRDVLAAVATLRGRGASQVAVVGESRGGAVVLAAAARAQATPGAAVTAVAALSPVWFPAVTSAAGATSLARVVPDVASPVLYLAARGDRQVDEGLLRAWARATPRARVVVHDGSAHGAALLGAPHPDAGYTRDLRPFLSRQLG